MYYLCLITCLLLAPIHSGEPDRLFMDDSPRQHEIPDERPRKMAWAEETDKKESDKKQLTYALYTHAFNAHMQRRLHMELAQATPLPAAANQLIIDYSPHQWAHVTTYSTSYRNIVQPGQQALWQLSSVRIHNEPFFAHAISPNGSTIVTCSRRALYVWKATQSFMRAKHSREMLFIRPPTDETSITAIAFSPCSNYLFVGSHTGKIYVFHLAAKKRVCTLVHDAPIATLTCNSDGSELRAQSETSVSVWNGSPFDPSFVADEEDIPAGPEQQNFSDSDDAFPSHLTPLEAQGLNDFNCYDDYLCNNFAIGYREECNYYICRSNGKVSAQEKCHLLCCGLATSSYSMMNNCHRRWLCLFCIPVIPFMCLTGCLGAMCSSNKCGGRTTSEA